MDNSEHTAVGAYGFQAYSPSAPGGIAVAGVTSIAEDIPSGVLPKLSYGPSNPLFWVLLIILIITGYLTFGFDIGLKKLGSLKVGT